MASPDLSAVLSEARGGFISDYVSPSAPATEPSPEPSGAPATPEAPAVASPASPEPPAAPVAPAVAPAPITIDPNTLESEARAFFERKGGDVNRILADALRNDSRLAALARGEADPLGQVKLGPTPAVPAQPEPPAAVAAPVDAQVIEQRLAQFYKSDPVCVQADQTWKANAARLTQIGDAQQLTGQLGEITKGLQRAQLLATFDEVKADAYRLQEVQRDIDKFEAARLRLEQEKDLLEGRNERALHTFFNAVERHKASVLGELQAQQQEQQQRAEYEAAVEAHAQALETNWTPALGRAMEAHKIHADDREDFQEEARNAAYAMLERGVNVEDLDGFLNKRAELYAARIDRNHRRQSAQYAERAGLRTAQTTTPGTGAVAPPQTAVAADRPLDEILSEAKRGFLQDARGDR